MNLEGGVNPSSRAELFVESETVTREPPPPYSPSTQSGIQPVIHQTIVIQQTLKNSPTFYNCVVCQERVLTEVKYENSNRTHLLAGFICGFTMWCCLCCLSAIPYLVSTCKKTEHYCPQCKTLLGSYSKI